MIEKVQKILANYGLGSRRKIEKIIISGLLYVNNIKIKIGDRLSPNSIYNVICNNQHYTFIRHKSKFVRVLLYHKPVGEICTHHDPNNRKTIFKKLPNINNQKWISVGRLDINTSGLLLLTNCGDLAYALMHPKFKVEREYKVRVFSTKDNTKKIKSLIIGKNFIDGFAHFDKISYCGGTGKNKWFRVILSEGKNKEVRRLWKSINYSVNKLIRIRYGDFVLPNNLIRGSYKELSKTEVDRLCQSVNIKFT
ncbi:MAG: pseudouridine synthase [Buchnera aphidicola (Eriosoma harunire)]